jgi:hypothetical protein
MKANRTIIVATTVLALLLGSLWAGSGVASAAVGEPQSNCIITHYPDPGGAGTDGLVVCG